jgi:hypothetical protein
VIEELEKRMKYATDNIEMLQTVTDDPASSDIRPTQDVDCMIELSSYKEHTELEEDLRAKGFANATSQGAPICRWIYQNIKVDVMPADKNVLEVC